jgi:hypothetical protein
MGTDLPEALAQAAFAGACRPQRWFACFPSSLCPAETISRRWATRQDLLPGIPDSDKSPAPKSTTTIRPTGPPEPGAFIVRYPASALKSPVNQQIGAAERPWTLPLHTGGTLLMPNSAAVRTNADDHQSAYTGSASLTSSLGRRPSIGNKDYGFLIPLSGNRVFASLTKVLPLGRKSSTNRAHAAHLAQSSSTANVVCATSAVTVSVNSCGVGRLSAKTWPWRG